MPTLPSYDQVPYESFALPETHPDYLATLGRLLGVPAAAPERCRVLELGSAAGGNLIPMAYGLPDSRFVGVELGADQARRGQAMIADLGLANIRLLHQDIMDVDEDQDPFDYILVHGVYSWVPEAVQGQILHLCGRLLAPHGIAYVSYNVLPGWRSRGMLRDMLLLRTRGADSAAERLGLAHGLLDMLAAGLAGDPRSEAEVLRREVEYLRKARASYLYHEYLEETNTPVLLSDFLDRALGQGLRYLADTQLHTMFVSTLGPAAQEVLAGIEPQAAQEQAMDFLTLRPFRRTLLVRAGLDPDLDIDLNRLYEFGLYADLRPVAPAVLDRVESQTYASAAEGRWQVEHPLTKALLAELAPLYPNALPLGILLERARGLVAAVGEGRHAEDADACLGELFSLYASQAIRLTGRTATWPTTVGDRPCASPLARAQAASGEGHAATARHRSLGLDALSARLLTLLDGQRDRAVLVAELIQVIGAEPALAAGLAAASGDGTALEAAVAANLDRLLRVYAREGLLVG
jgi:SAM-dependent methyltransferase